MKIGAIITGDIVDSTLMTSSERNQMLSLLSSLPGMLSSLSKIDLEIFRGDSFQIRVYDIACSLKIAIVIRAFLRSNSFVSYNKQWDARLALGIGALDYETANIGASDGEAYRLSGKCLDSIGRARLRVETPWVDLNEELFITTSFADDIVSAWTQSQSRVLLQYFTTDMTHAEIGGALGVTRQNVDKALKTAKIDLIDMYLHRFIQLINYKIS